MISVTLLGYILISGFVLTLVATFSGPPGLYQESDTNKQNQIILDNISRWNLSNWLYAIAGVLSASGLLFYSQRASITVSPLLSWGAGLLFSLGIVFWIIFLMQRNKDPESLFSNYKFSPISAAMLGLSITGLFVYGFVFLQEGLPNWLAYTTLGLNGLSGLLALLFPGPFFKNYPPQLLFIVGPLLGITLLIA